MPMSSPQARSTPRNASLNQPEMSVEQASATSRNEYLGQVVEAQSRNTHLDNQVAKLRAELAKKNDQMEQQQTLISEYVSENRTKRSELEAKYADLGKRYEQLLGVLTSLEGSKMTLQERCAVVQREREAAEMKLNAQGKTLAAVSDSQVSGIGIAGCLCCNAIAAQHPPLVTFGAPLRRSYKRVLRDNGQQSSFPS